MKIDEVAPGAKRLSLWPLDVVNAYVLGDVLVDSGGRMGARRLLSALTGTELRAHALTHAHFDHQGASHAVCEALGIPLWCGQGDRSAVESGDLTRLAPNPDSPIWRVAQRFAGPPHLVSRTLREGDEVGGFEAIEAPGHTPGHLAFWRESDRVLVLGDVLFHRNPVTLRHGLAEPFRWATYDVRQNRESGRKLAALKPAVICFGHGEPLWEPELFARFVSSPSG